MISFSNKLPLSSTLYPPYFGFDADYNQLKFALRDERDNSSIQYTINSRIFNVSVPGSKISYQLPEIDRLYDMTYTVFPQNSAKYKGTTYTTSIFSNHTRCKDFKYSGDRFDSDDIDGYRGTLNYVYIPRKHNLVSTHSATITSFPFVSDSRVDISTSEDMREFWIKDNKIRSFDLRGTLSNPVNYQFSDLQNLENITGIPFISTCKDYMFTNCFRLNMDPIMTANFTNVGIRAFYNTPNQKAVILDTNTIGAETFDYSSDITGFIDYQKVIFTQADTINGFNQKTLITDENNYTGGMIYHNPDNGQTENHQVFCGLKTYYWTGQVPTDDTVRFIDRIDRGNDHMLIFRCDDNNVIGMKIVITNPSGWQKGELLWLPQSKNRDHYDNRDDRKEHPYFYISESLLYTSRPSTTSSGTQTGPGLSVGTDIIITPGYINTDIFHITPISCRGLSENTYVFNSGGELNPTNPSGSINKVLCTGGATTWELNINNGEWRHIGSSAPNHSYILYITMDETITIKNVMFRLWNGTTYDNGTDGKLTQYHDFTNDQYISLGGRKVYKLELNQYYGYNDVLSTSKTLRMYYNGYTEPYYDISLSKKLSGTVN